MDDNYVHSTSPWQVTKHHLKLSFYSKNYDWPVKELFKLSSEFWKLLQAVTVLKADEMLISSLCSFPLSCTKQAEEPGQMADCSELMHRRDCLQSTKCNCCVCVEMLCFQQHNIQWMNALCNSLGPQQLPPVKYCTLAQPGSLPASLAGCQKDHSFSSSKSNCLVKH